MAKIFKKPTGYSKITRETIGDRVIAVWKERTFTSYGAKAPDSYRVSVTSKETGKIIFKTDDSNWNHISEHAEQQYKYGEKMRNSSSSRGAGSTSTSGT